MIQIKIFEYGSEDYINSWLRNEQLTNGSYKIIDIKRFYRKAYYDDGRYYDTFTETMVIYETNRHLEKSTMFTNEMMMMPFSSR